MVVPGIAVGTGGTIYAIDGSHNRVQTFAADGTAGASFGSFNGAFGIALDELPRCLRGGHGQ